MRVPVYKKILVLAKLQCHTNVPLGVCDRHNEMVYSSTKNGGLADSKTLNIPYSPCFPYLAFCCYFCRTNLALSDISCIFCNFVGHILLCRTYLAFCCHFCRTNLALSDISCGFFNHFCRTYLALSDISCVCLSFWSDTSSCGHNWLCRTYLACSG